MALTTLCTVMAKRLLTSNDKSLTRALRLERGWGSHRMIREFPQRKWKRSTLNDLIKKIDETGDTKRKQGSCRPRSVPSERLLKGRKHFSQSIMVSVAVSQLGKSSLVFVERGAKVNSSYYCDVVLHQGLLPDIIAHSGDNFTFQQDGAPALRSRKTVAFLTAHVPDFIEPENWPPNSPDLNPVDYSIWGVLQQLVCRQRNRDIEHSFERSSDRMLGRNQRGHYQPGCWTVSQAIIIGYRSKRRTY